MRHFVLVVAILLMVYTVFANSQSSNLETIKPNPKKTEHKEGLLSTSPASNSSKKWGQLVIGRSQEYQK